MSEYEDLRLAAEGAKGVLDEPWPGRPIQQRGTCDGCAETRDLVMAYDDPSGANEPWVCAECAAATDYIAAASPDRILGLLDALARVEALADEWRGWAVGRSSLRIDAFRDAAEQVTAALPAPTHTEDEGVGR